MADDKASGGEKLTFTEGESKLLLGILKYLTSDIQFDADAIASELGYKDGGVVKMRWRQIKNKKLALAGASPGGIKKRAPKKATPKKVKAEDEAEDDAEQVSTPSKDPKKRVTKSKAAQQNEDGMKIKDEVAEEDE